MKNVPFTGDSEASWLTTPRLRVKGCPEEGGMKMKAVISSQIAGHAKIQNRFAFDLKFSFNSFEMKALTAHHLISKAVSR